MIQKSLNVLDSVRGSGLIDPDWEELEEVEKAIVPGEKRGGGNLSPITRQC